MASRCGSHCWPLFWETCRECLLRHDDHHAPPHTTIAETERAREVKMDDVLKLTFRLRGHA